MLQSRAACCTVLRDVRSRAEGGSAIWTVRLPEGWRAPFPGARKVEHSFRADSVCCDVHVRSLARGRYFAPCRCVAFNSSFGCASGFFKNPMWSSGCASLWNHTNPKFRTESTDGRFWCRAVFWNFGFRCRVGAVHSKFGVAQARAASCIEIWWKVAQSGAMHSKFGGKQARALAQHHAFD
jgi:hypothetical protein